MTRYTVSENNDPRRWSADGKINNCRHDVEERRKSKGNSVLLCSSAKLWALHWARCLPNIKNTRRPIHYAKWTRRLGEEPNLGYISLCWNTHSPTYSRTAVLDRLRVVAISTTSGLDLCAVAQISVNDKGDLLWALRSEPGDVGDGRPPAGSRGRAHSGLRAKDSWNWNVTGDDHVGGARCRPGEHFPDGANRGDVLDAARALWDCGW